jgi:hypothetical protein
MRMAIRIAVLASLFILPLASFQAQAQPDCTDENLLAIVFENGEINAEATPFQQVTAHLYLLNITADCMCGIEFNLGLPSNLLVLNTTWSINVTDVGGGNGNYIVGFGDELCATGEDLLVCTFNFLYASTTGEMVDIFLGPAEPASVDGFMGWLDCDEIGIVQTAWPISDDYNLPVARINGPDLDYCEGSVDAVWSLNISTDGDTENLAGVHVQASDGYDPGLDVIDDDPNARIYFSHPEYPGFAQKLERDFRAPYDPLAEIKQWDFVVDSYAEPPSQSDPGGNTNVLLTFTTDLDLSPGFDAFVVDQNTGGQFLVTPAFQYSYTIPYGNSSRQFTLVVGEEPSTGPEPLQFFFDAHLGQLADTGNLGRTDELATADFDPALDEPEPGPPPSDYLLAYFNHPDWPIGSRYKTDTRPIFDPLQEMETWPITVETDQSGYVNLTFNPDFTQADGIPFKITDLAAGTTYDLFPGLSYEFLADGGHATYDFSVMIGGTSGPPELDPTERQLPQGWAMVGFPLVPSGDTSLGGVITDQAPGFSYMFSYQAESLRYTVAPATEGASQTAGYWIANTVGYEWTMAGERDLNWVLTPLAPGWNLVSYPMWFNGPLNGVEVLSGGANYTWDEAVDAGIINPTVYGYDSDQDNYVVAETLEPWNGYWVRAQLPDVTLRFQWENFVTVPLLRHKLVLDQIPQEEKWSTDLVLNTEDDKSRLITFGVHPLAGEGFDLMHDHPAPPKSPGGGPSLVFDRPEFAEEGGRYFQTDFVAMDAEKYEWNAVITTNTPGEVTLTWTCFDWPKGHDLQLYLPETNRVVVNSMAEEFSTTLDVGRDPLRIRVRTPDMTSGVEDLPSVDYAIKAHPNPFNPMTTISFSLAQAGHAEIKVYTVRGELVDTLVGQNLEAGLHKVIWRGKDRRGAGVPSGSYFAKLYVDGRDVGPVVKMSLVR